jgi:hypothetical protein
MSWIEELVRDPTLQDQWIWHAQAQFLSKDETTASEEPFVTNPMTAAHAWQAEVRRGCFL